MSDKICPHCGYTDKTGGEWVEVIRKGKKTEMHVICVKLHDKQQKRRF